MEINYDNSKKRANGINGCLKLVLLISGTSSFTCVSIMCVVTFFCLLTLL